MRKIHAAVRRVSFLQSGRPGEKARKLAEKSDESDRGNHVGSRGLLVDPSGTVWNKYRRRWKE